MLDLSSLRFAAVLAALICAAPTISASQSPGPVDEILVTTDAEPGWLPSPDQRQAAERNIANDPAGLTLWSFAAVGHAA